MLTTLSGMPAAAMASASRNASSTVSGDGFMTIVHPAASAGRAQEEAGGRGLGGGAGGRGEYHHPFGQKNFTDVQERGPPHRPGPPRPLAILPRAPPRA